MLSSQAMLAAALLCLLSAAPTWSAANAAPAYTAGDAQSWASLAVLGVAADGRVAIAVERGWANEGFDYSYVVQLIDPAGELPFEQLSYGTDDAEHQTREAAWEARGREFSAMLTAARVRPKRAGWTAEASARPEWLEVIPEPVEDAYFDEISIEARVKQRPWFRTERSLIRGLHWSGAIHSPRGELHVFLALDRGWEGVPGRWLMVEPLSPSA